MARHLSTEIRLDAPPETVWRVLTDFAAYPDWNPFVTSLAGDLRLGARLTARIVLPGTRGMTLRPTVVALEPPARLAWLGHLFVPGLFSGRHSFTLEPLPDGGTRLLHEERFSGVLVPLVWPGMATATRAGFVSFNEALKARVEAGKP
jgi:hypothetical protein